ncbi:DUF3558 domain-containing protein [Amycolatopsis sp. NPDC059657]|uniref:DUF3558 domain-containing protein n=1 Tax=Amycolatopsis sp. NPDC059657 TaxID=3346899 RepID=UPI00366BA8AA
MKRATIFSVLVAAGFTMAACSTSTGGTATPSPSTAGPATGTSKTKLTAPPVTNPLDAAKYEQNPCGVLNPAQASQVANLTKAGEPFGGQFKICQWKDDNYSGISFSFIRGGGLSDTYSNQDDDSGYFKVAPDVSGYPAVFAGITDDRSKGGCQMSVGVSETVQMVVNSSFDKSSPLYSDPCSVTQKAAEAAIATLKGGS